MFDKLYTGKTTKKEAKEMKAELYRRSVEPHGQIMDMRIRRAIDYCDDIEGSKA